MWELYTGQDGLPQSMVAGFQEQVSQEDQEEAESSFMTSPQIQGKGTRLYFSMEVSNLERNKSMLIIRYYRGHFWKIQLTTNALEAKGGISN